MDTETPLPKVLLDTNTDALILISPLVLGVNDCEIAVVFDVEFDCNSAYWYDEFLFITELTADV